jgi:hypothetical protein
LNSYPAFAGFSATGQQLDTTGLQLEPTGEQLETTEEIIKNYGLEITIKLITSGIIYFPVTTRQRYKITR